MSRMLDRNQYDPRMITNIEIMTAYFIDIFYNHLYFEGKKLKANGNVVSVTEGYKHALNAFIKSLSNPKLYKKAVIGIHQYFLNYTSFTTISFAKCVDRIAANFVPVDYYASLDNTQKMSILRLVINQAIKTFTKKLVNDHLTKIIDNHQEADNVRLLQDELVDVFLLEREAVYQRFISSQTHTHTDENINRLVSEKMQHEIKNLILEKIQLKKENEALKKIIVKNNDEIAKLKENSGTHEATVIELKSDLEKMKSAESSPFSRLSQLPSFTPVNRGNLLQVLDMPRKRGGLPLREIEPAHDPPPEVSDFISRLGVMEITELPDDSDADEPLRPNNLDFSDDDDFKAPAQAVPKKKRPSSELGDGVTLDSFY